jgi:hypothetical protein
MFAYGVVWVLGGGYLILGAIALYSPPFYLLIALFFAWGALVSFIAWRRHRRSRPAPETASNPAERRAHLRQGFAVVALLISLVIATMEWDFVGEHQGHLLGALLWSAGVVGSILLAQGNRRATVIVTMRAYLVLVVIGAMAGEKAAGLIFAAFAVAIYVAVEKLWKKPQPPVLELEALSRDPEARGNGSHVETKRH